MLGQNIGRVGLPDMSSGGRPSLTLDFVGIQVLNERITFTRASGATWFSPDGVLEGVDFSTSSVAIGTGSKTFTLTADAGSNRYWAVGDLVRVSQQSNSANFMEGTVTSYTVSTQVLVIDVTSTGGSGTIASWRVSSHMPRFDYNPSTLAAQGLLIEDARTNLLTRSEELNDASWVVGDITVTANNTTAPNGTTTADLLTEGTAGTAFITRSASATVSAGAAVTGSFFVKRSSVIQWLRVRLSNDSATNGGNVWFDIQNGVLGNQTNLGSGTATSGTITSINNGWYRVTVTTTLAVGDTTALLGFTSASGNGSTTRVNNSAYWGWGAQLEAGAFPTSYIPTTTTALTRNRDEASVNTLSPWYNATEGTLYGEITDAAITVSGTSRRIANINDGTEADRITVGWAGAISVAAAFVTDNSVAQAGFTSPSGAYPFPTKVALAYKAADFQAAVNGSAFAAVSSGTVPTVNRMTIGDVVTGSSGLQNLNGHVRRITYYPRRLSQAELTAITA